MAGKTDPGQTMNHVEIIRENLSTEAVMRLREQEISKGNQVNIRRINSDLVEIEIISDSRQVIDVTPYRKSYSTDLA